MSDPHPRPTPLDYQPVSPRRMVRSEGPKPSHLIFSFLTGSSLTALLLGAVPLAVYIAGALAFLILVSLMSAGLKK